MRIRIRREIYSNNIEETTLTLEGNKLIDFSCTCDFMSFYYWSKKFQASGTICRHILQICAEEGIELPEKNKTERNLRVMKTFKK